MYCGGCDNIPFWKWLIETQTYPTSITCNDFDGENLSNLQPNNGTGSLGEYLCTWFWKCYQIYRMDIILSTCFSIKMIYPPSCSHVYLPKSKAMS